MATDWLRQMVRAWKVTDNQVRSLRRFGHVTDSKAGRRQGSYWGISTRYADYGRRIIEVDESWAGYLKQVPTRLNTIQPALRKQLINFSYSLTDAALRSYVIGDAELSEPSLPYPEEPLDRPARLPFAKTPIWKFWR